MHAVNLQPLYDTLDQVIILLATGFIGWLGMEVRGWFAAHKTFLDQKTQETLANGFERALQNGVNIATQQLHTYEGAHETVEVNGWIAAKAAQYAIDHSPDYMQKFGLSPDQVATKALAYLPPPPPIATDTTGATVKTEAVSVTPLPPTG